MFEVGDIVQHKTTGKLDKVVGYGCQIADRTYMMSPKVKPLPRHYFRLPIEDTINPWRIVRYSCPQLLVPGWQRRNHAA